MSEPKSAQPEPDAQAQPTSGWLVELIGQHRYWNGRGNGPISFDSDHKNALRFARRVDAERARDTFLLRALLPQVAVVEHSWEKMMDYVPNYRPAPVQGCNECNYGLDDFVGEVCEHCGRTGTRNRPIEPEPTTDHTRLAPPERVSESDPRGDVVVRLTHLRAACDDYIEYLNSDGPLGTDAFKRIKGRVITLACILTGQQRAGTVQPEQDTDMVGTEPRPDYICKRCGGTKPTCCSCPQPIGPQNAYQAWCEERKSLVGHWPTDQLAAADIAITRVTTRLATQVGSYGNQPLSEASGSAPSAAPSSASPRVGDWIRLAGDESGPRIEIVDSAPFDGGNGHPRVQIHSRGSVEIADIQELRAGTEPRERILLASGWSHKPMATTDDCRLAAARETIIVVEEQIRAQFTPSLNTGTAWDALILVGTVFRELLADLSPASDDGKVK